MRRAHKKKHDKRSTKSIAKKHSRKINKEYISEHQIPDESPAFSQVLVDSNEVMSPSHANKQHEAAEHYPYDEALLDVSRTRWQLCDWARLATMNSEMLQHHPDRAKLALLVASAHFQRDNFHQANRLLQLALDWGANHRMAAQLLISGIHHCLADSMDILGEEEAAHKHRKESLRSSGVPGDVDLLAEARAVLSRRKLSEV